MPEEKTERAKIRISQWIADQGEPAQGAEELQEAPEAPRDKSEEVPVVATPVDEVMENPPTPGIELESRPADDSERRFATPERRPAVKRNMGQESDVERIRRRISTPPADQVMNAGDDMFDIPDDAFDNPHTEDDSPLRPWYIGDADMPGLHEVDRKILASVLLSVDITEVYSPTRVNQVAAKFGLTPGSSLDLTNGYDFEKAEDCRKAWRLISKTRPFMVIGSPPVPYSAISRT